MENFFQRDLITGKTDWKKVSLEKLRSSDFIGYDSTCRNVDRNGILILKNKQRSKEEAIKIGMSDFTQKFGELEEIIKNNNIDDVKKKQIKIYGEMQRILNQVENSDADPSIHLEYWGRVIVPNMNFGDLTYDIETLKFHEQKGHRVEAGNIYSILDGNRRIRGIKIYNSPLIRFEGYYEGEIMKPNFLENQIEDWRKDHLTDISLKLYGKRIDEIEFPDEKRYLNQNL